MPRVPSYDSPTVAPTTQGVAAPSISPIKIAGDQAQQIGGHLMSASQQINAVTSEFQRQYNETRVLEAQNKATKAMADLRFGGPDGAQGYTQVLGGQVGQVDGPDGKPMTLRDAYGAKLSKHFDDIAQGLGNEAQREAFNQFSLRARAQFDNETSEHQAAQMKVAAISAAQDQTVVGANTIVSNIGNPNVVAEGMRHINDGLDRQAVLAGKARWQDGDKYGYPLVTNPDRPQWDKRADGSAKGMGWLGLRQRPDGGVSSEISVGVEIKGKEVEIPLMVPGLNKTEMDYLMNNDPGDKDFLKNLPPSIMDKAKAFAQGRIDSGKSPFRADNEESPDAQPAARHLAFNSPEDRENFDVERKTALAQSYSAVLEALVEHRQPTQALAFLESQKDNLNKIDYDRLYGKVKDAAAGAEAVAAVDNVLTGVGWNGSMDSPPPFQKVDDMLRKRFGDDPTALQAARSEFHTRFSNWGSERSARQEVADKLARDATASGKSIQWQMQQSWWPDVSNKETAVNNQQNFIDNVAGNPTAAAKINANMITYAKTAHKLNDAQALALAALAVGEGGGENVLNTAGGGHGAYGFFQLRDSGGLKEMKALYGEHPTMQQQVDYFLTHYSKKNSAFWSAQDPVSALQALAQGQGAGSGTNGIWVRGLQALKGYSSGTQNYDGNADAFLANPETIGPMTPQNITRITNMVGPKYAQKIINTGNKWQSDTAKAAMPTQAEMDQVLTSLGVPTGKTNDAKVLALRAQIRANLHDQLVEEAKGGSDIKNQDERQRSIQRIAATTVQVYSHGIFSDGYEEKPLITMAAGDVKNITAYDSIPVNDRNTVIAGLHKSGIDHPSKNDVVRAYYQQHGWHLPQ